MGKYEDSGSELHSRKNLAAECLLLVSVCTEKEISESLADFASNIRDKNLYVCNMEKALLCKSLKYSKHRLILTEQ